MSSGSDVCFPSVLRIHPSPGKAFPQSSVPSFPEKDFRYWLWKLPLHLRSDFSDDVPLSPGSQDISVLPDL